MSGTAAPILTSIQGVGFFSNTPAVAAALDLQSAVANAQAAVAAVPGAISQIQSAAQGAVAQISAAAASAQAQKMTTAYVGALNGATDLTNAANFPNLLSSGNCSFYLTSYALTQVAGLSASLGEVVGTFAEAAPGILEVGVEPVNMPDIASTYAADVTASNGWTWGPTKGTAWPGIIKAAGWTPTIATLNIFNMSFGALPPAQDPYYAMNLAAIADVKAAGPSIKYVLPFITPNNASVTTAAGNDQWNNPYWQNYRELALAAGGMALDVPANYALSVQTPLYLPLIVQMLAWAAQNNLLTAVLLSPYALNNGNQEGADSTFAQAAAQVVAYLQSNGVAPSIYVGTNYGEATTSNRPGTDTTPNSTAQVALFLASSAATTPYTLSTTLQRAPLSVSRPAALRDLRGFGDLAYQTSYNVNIQGGSATFTSPVTAPGLTSTGDVDLQVGHSLALGAGASVVAYAHADGTGNLTLDPGLPNGNVIIPGNLNLMGSLTSNGNTIIAANATTGVVTVTGKNIEIGEAGGGIAFFGSKFAGQSAVSGSVGSATAATLKNLIAALALTGLITDQTTA